MNALGRQEEARRAFKKAQTIWEREMGPDGLNLAYALTGAGNSYLAEGNAASALPPLERALRIREAKETDPAKLSETRFAMARALWSSNRNRKLARDLADHARRGYLKANLKKRADEVERWMKSCGIG